MIHQLDMVLSGIQPKCVLHGPKIVWIFSPRGKGEGLRSVRTPGIMTLQSTRATNTLEIFIFTNE